MNITDAETTLHLLEHGNILLFRVAKIIVNFFRQKIHWQALTSLEHFGNCFFHFSQIIRTFTLRYWLLMLATKCIKTFFYRQKRKSIVSRLDLLTRKPVCNLLLLRRLSWPYIVLCLKYERINRVERVL